MGDVTRSAPSVRDVAVVISTAAARLDHLREQLDALRKQIDAPEFAVIVVDNRGSLELPELIADYVEAGLPISLVAAGDVHNRSFGANYGAACAVGATYLLFLDDDDVVSEDYVTKMHTALLDHPYVGARMSVHELNEAPWVFRRQLLQHRTIPTHAGHPFVVGAATGIRRDLFQRVGGYDVGLATQEDVDLGIRLQQIGVTPRLVPAATLHYRYRSSYRQTFQQERAYGTGEVDLAVKHQLGRRPLRAVLGSAYAIVRALVGPWSPAARASLCTQLGAQVGRFQGSARRRVMYP